MKLNNFCAATAVLAFSAAATGQDLCPPGIPVSGYVSRSIPGSFASITGNPGVVNLFGTGTNDATATVLFPSGFTFSYAGVVRDRVHVCSNGWAAFASTTSTTGANVHIDDAAEPNETAFVWHDDLVLTALNSSVDYQVITTAGAGSMTIQWSNVGNFVTGSPLTGKGSFTFQMVLFASNHATKANQIEFRYDRTTAPPVMDFCETLNPSTYATTATVGCEGEPDVFGVLRGGTDPTDRGAANARFPLSDLRMQFQNYIGYTPAVQVIESEFNDFCHRDKNKDTIFITGGCVDLCFDEFVSSQTMGSQIDIPWKFNLFGRPTKSFVMNYNGYLALGEGTSNFNPNNDVITNTAGPNGLIAPFWDDHEAGKKSEMQYRIIGRPGCRVVSVEWHEPHPHAGTVGDCISSEEGFITMNAKIFEAGAGDISSTTPPCPYDLVLPGNGDDKIELTYDSLESSPGGFSATIGVENYNGTFGAAAIPGNNIPQPNMNSKYTFVQSNCGTIRYYGDGSANFSGACIPEFQTNGVAPIIGNTAGMRVVGASTVFRSALLVDFNPAPTGQGIPCPCGGFDSPFGRFFIDINSSNLAVFPAGLTTAGGACEGSAQVDVPIPVNPMLVGQAAFAQWIVFKPVSPTILNVELTEGAKIVFGS